MPLRLGTPAPSLRLGTSAVSRAYLGTALVYSAGSTPPPNPGPSAPPAPTGMVAVAGDATATLSWQSVAGSTAWIVQYSSTNGASWSDIPGGGVAFSSAPAATGTSTLSVTATVSGLSNGVAYVFRAATQKSGLWSDYSAASAPVVPLAAATTPASLTATTQSGTPYVFVTWDGGDVQATSVGAVDHWIEKSADSGATWTPSGSFRFSEAKAKTVRLFGGNSAALPADASIAWPSPLVLASFAANTQYIFRLRRSICARVSDTQCVQGPYSGWSLSSAPLTTPPAVPSAATGVSAEPVSGGIAVTWLPPQFVGSDLTAYEGPSSSVVYTVTAVPMSGSGSPVSVTVAAASAPSSVIFTAFRGAVPVPARRVVLTGLTNGVAHAVSVKISNSSGTGPDTTVLGVTPSASIPCAFESLVGQPRPPCWSGSALGVTVTYPTAALVVGTAEWSQWPGTAATRAAQTEVQYTMADDIAAPTSAGVAENIASGWFKPATGDTLTAATWSAVGSSMEYRMGGYYRTFSGMSVPNRIGPPLAYGKTYVFRVRKSASGILSPWTYATFTAPTCGMV